MLGIVDTSEQKVDFSMLIIVLCKAQYQSFLPKADACVGMTAVIK